MKLSRFAPVVPLALLLALPAAAEETFKVGIPLPLTGSEAKFGEMEKQAYEMAAGEINSRGGARGMKLELEFFDSAGKPESATAIAEKIVAGKQPILIGEYNSQCSHAVAGLAERVKVPYLVVTGAADKITQQGWKYVFRLNPPSSLYATGLLSFFDEVAHPKSIAILYENTDFGTSTAKAMKEACEARKIDIVLNLPVTERFQSAAAPLDFRPVLQKVKAANPEVVYMVSYLAEATALMKQAKELDLNPKAFIGGAAGFTMPEFLKSAPSDFVLSGTLWTPEAKYPGAKAFFDRFKSKFGKEPDYHGAEAYAAVYVLADVLKRARSLSPDDLRDALAATDLMTAFGPVKFVSWGQFTNQNRMNTLVQQVLKGEFETVWPKNAASAAAVYPVPHWKDRK